MATIANLVVEIEGKSTQFKITLEESKRNVKKFEKESSTSFRNVFKTAGKAAKTFIADIRKIGRSLRRMASVGLNGLRRLARGFRRLGAIISGTFLASIALVGFQIIKTANEIDAVAKSARQLNIGVVAFQELAFAAGLAGVNNEKLSATLRFMNRTIGETAIGIGAAKQAFEALGLDARDLINLSLDDQFEKITEALRGVRNETTRVALQARFFGAEGIFATNKLINGVRQAREEFRGLGVALTAEQSELVESFNDSRNKLLAVWDGFKQQTVAAIAPAFQLIIDNLRQTIIENGGVQAAAQKMSTFLLRAANFAQEGIKELFKEYQAGFPTLMKFREDAVEVFNAIKDAVITVTRAVNDLGEALEKRRRLIASYGAALEDAIGSNQDAIKAAEDFANGLISADEAFSRGATRSALDSIAKQLAFNTEQALKFRTEIEGIGVAAKAVIPSIQGLFGTGPSSAGTSSSGGGRGVAFNPASLTTQDIASKFEAAGESFEKSVGRSAEKLERAVSGRQTPTASTASTLGERIREDRATLAGIRAQQRDARRSAQRPGSSSTFGILAARAIGNTGPSSGVDARTSIEELFQRQEAVMKAQEQADQKNREPAVINVTIQGDLSPLIKSVTIDPEFKAALQKQSERVMENSARTTRR